MRQRIMMAAAEEMKVRSIKFTMTDLATRLGVSKRLLYEHFSSKDELIGAIVDACLEDAYQNTLRILNDPERPVSEKLEAFLIPRQSVLLLEGQIAEDIKRFLPGEWEKFGRFAEEKWEMLEGLLKEGIEKGELRPVCLPIVEKMIYGSKKEMVDRQFLSEHNPSLKDTCRYIADVLMYGMIARNQ